MINNADISVLIENPGMLKNANIEQLSELVEFYPYFQTAHILLLKALKDNGSDDFQPQLGKSSIYISDRDLLFKFLNQEFKIENKQVEEVTEVVNKEDQKEEKKDTNQLKNKKVRRKIVDSAEGMGANISETISSQIVFSTLKDKDKLEYSSEIYFIEEERDGKNQVVTIDAKPDHLKKLKKDKDILDLDENQSDTEQSVVDNESETQEAFELIDSEEVEKDSIEKNKQRKSEYFNINNYADEDELELQDDLITRFIEKNPRIETKEIKEEEAIDISEDSVKEDSNLLSETLIKVYIEQGLFEKAIESYKKLSLKYPEKSAYFASQIKILEDKLN
ncbi:MAG: hypothetical protein KQH79_15135 [Bacteroidetes bacterium]|nr:hypothetical protein [Bacteroidota bacterium]